MTAGRVKNTAKIKAPSRFLKPFMSLAKYTEDRIKNRRQRKGKSKKKKNSMVSIYLPRVEHFSKSFKPQTHYKLHL